MKIRRGLRYPSMVILQQKHLTKYKLYVILNNQTRNDLITNKVHRLLHLCYTAEADLLSRKLLILM